MRDLNKLNETEINRIIFDGAGAYEHRGLSDSLTDDEIVGLVDHPQWHDFTTNFQDWIWQSVDSVLHCDAWVQS